MGSKRDLKLELTTLELSDQKTPNEYVKLSTEYYHTNRGIYKKRCITFLRKKSRGYSMLEEEANMTNAREALETISTDIDDLEDGEYLVYPIVHRDGWGEVDSVEYKLIKETE